MGKKNKQAISSYRKDTDENQWFVTNCLFRFEKIKGIVKTESNKKTLTPGEWFQCLVKDHKYIKGTFICLVQPEEILHKATIEEIKEHVFK